MMTKYNEDDDTDYDSSRREDNSAKTALLNPRPGSHGLWKAAVVSKCKNPTWNSSVLR